jgi:hypothetical protein
MAKGVWIVAELRDGAFRKVSYELASTARKLPMRSAKKSALSFSARVLKE